MAAIERQIEVFGWHRAVEGTESLETAGRTRTGASLIRLRLGFDGSVAPSVILAGLGRVVFVTLAAVRASVVVVFLSLV